MDDWWCAVKHLLVLVHLVCWILSGTEVLSSSILCTLVDILNYQMVLIVQNNARDREVGVNNASVKLSCCHFLNLVKMKLCKEIWDVCKTSFTVSKTQNVLRFREWHF